MNYYGKKMCYFCKFHESSNPVLSRMKELIAEDALRPPAIADADWNCLDTAYIPQTGWDTKSEFNLVLREEMVSCLSKKALAQSKKKKKKTKKKTRKQINMSLRFSRFYTIQFTFLGEKIIFVKKYF